MRLRRVLAVTAVASAFVLLTTLPAGAQNGGGAGGDHSRRINITGGLVVAEGETVDGPTISADGDALISGRVNGAVYVGRGDLVVRGRVTGDALVLDGDAVISGRVDGDVIVINGKATVRPGADVRGDVTSRTTPTAAKGTVQGHVKKFDLESAFTGFLVVILALLWVAVTISTAILGLLFVALFPRAADATVDAGKRVWVSLFWGLVVGILGPVLGILFMTSVVGIPLGGAILGTVAVLGPLGYVAGALGFGRLLVKRPTAGGRIGAFFAGFGILRFAALVPGLGFLVGLVFAMYGLGALVVAGWRGAHRTGVEAPGMPPAPAVATGGRPTGPAGAMAPAAVAPVPATRRAPVRKATRKKTTARKKAAKRAPARKKAAKKPTARKKAAKRAPPRKKAAKRAPARKKAAKRAPARKKAAKKTTARKKAARKSTTKRASAKKTPAKRTKKATKKKTPAKKATGARAKKRTARKSTRRTTTAKTGPAKRSSATRRRTAATARSRRSHARRGSRAGR